MKIRTLTKVGLASLYLSRFALTTVPAQLLLLGLSLRKPRAPRRVTLYLLALAVYVSAVLLLNPSPVPLRNILYYFSFLPPFLVMLSAKNDEARFTVTTGFILAICVATIAEAILINTPIGADVWFFPADHPHRHLIFGNGWYQRPSGIAGIASSTASIVVISLVLSDVFEPHWGLFSAKNTFAVLALVVLATGTGFMYFMFYLVLKLLGGKVGSRRTRLGTKVSLFVVIGLLLYGATGGLWTRELNKFSFDYAWLIVENKMVMFRDSEPSTALEFLFGGQASQSASVLNTSSDFGYFGMFHAMGVIGCVLVLCAPFLFYRSLRYFVLPTVFFFLSFVHYPALSSPPGAVLFALYLFMLHSHRKVVNVVKPNPERLPLSA